MCQKSLPPLKATVHINCVTSLQGVRCYLTGICPVAADGRWTPGATELLKARILTTETTGIRECRVEFKGHNEQKGHEINLFSSRETQGMHKSVNFTTAQV